MRGVFLDPAVGTGIGPTATPTRGSPVFNWRRLRERASLLDGRRATSLPGGEVSVGARPTGFVVHIGQSLFHITHQDNLAGMARTGELLSENERSRRGVPARVIAMSHVRSRRALLPVPLHAGDRVADYVPFHFRPRSLMLYVIQRADHPHLASHGGQARVVHLCADIRDVVEWCVSVERAWVFTESNAAERGVMFHTGLDRLSQIDWRSIASPDGRSIHARRTQQAEFLVRDSVPWRLISYVGVFDEAGRRAAERSLEPFDHRPTIRVRTDWYYGGPVT